MHPQRQQEERLLLDCLKTEADKKAFVHKLLESLGPEGQQWLAIRILGTTPCETSGNFEFAKSIGARQYPPAEQRALELASLMNFFSYRKQLLASAIAATKVADMLGVSRQTIHDRLSKGQLIGVMDNNTFKFPAWQFDPEGPNGVVAGLSEVLDSMSCTPVAKISWLTTASSVFEGLRPIDVLKQGRITEVVHEAQAVGVA